MVTKKVVQFIDGVPVNTELLDNLDEWPLGQSPVSPFDAVYLTSEGKLARALADGSLASQCLGMVKAVITQNACLALTQGKIENFPGTLRAGYQYYLSDKTPGKIVPIPPPIAVPVGIAASETTLYVNPSPLEHHRESLVYTHTVRDSYWGSRQRTAKENLDMVDATTTFPLDCDSLNLIFPKGWCLYWVGSVSVAKPPHPKPKIHVKIRNDDGRRIGSGPPIGEFQLDLSDKKGNADILWGIKCGPFDSKHTPRDGVRTCSISFWQNNAQLFYLGNWKIVAIGKQGTV
mgnify:CR=1 FL=1|jgi:hypothetical protein